MKKQIEEILNKNLRITAILDGVINVKNVQREIISLFKTKTKELYEECTKPNKTR